MQLLADAEPVGRRSHRHAGGPADPEGSGDVAVGKMVARLLSISSLSGELTFEGVDDGSQLLEIYPPLLTRLKPANRRLQLREGCTPFPQHPNSIPNICLEVNVRRTINP